MNMMKKYLFMLAAFIAATATFTACSSEDNLSGEQESELTGAPIKAQFTITIPMSTGSITRQSGAIVQDGADADVTKFRGIDQIKLYPSTVASASLAGASTIGAGITLTQMLKPVSQTVANYIPKTTALWENNKSVLYNDVLLSTGTQTFLFYGKAIDGTANVAITTPDEKFKYGTLTAEVPDAPGTPSAISFAPVAITTATGSDTKRNALLAYINSIADAQYTEESTTYTWKTNTLVGLSTLYTQFTSMKAGSSKNLEAAVEDLYNSLKGSADKMSVAICTAIEAGVTAGNVTITNPTTAVDKYTVVFNENGALAGYPSVSDNLPDGAANIKWTGTAFQYVEDKDDAASNNVTPIGKFAFPANLYYWVKSGIMTSKTPQSSNYNADMTWDNAENTGIFNKYTDGTAITSNTQSLILTDPVQYGVGRLDIKVVASAISLADNGEGTVDGQKTIGINDFKLTGVLIANQNSVGWNFQPTGAEGYTMYDNILKSQNITDGLAITNKTFANTAVMNHTLVLETAGSATEKVKVVLEFVNNGQDFWGDGGIVPTGTKFYLVGELSMEKALAAAAGDDDKVASINAIGKVFKQDYTTLANFTIKNLKKAINHIPDLRNPRLELGLSVDLGWKEGITFGYNFE